MYVCLCVNMCVCVYTCMYACASALRSQKRALDPLELVLQSCELPDADAGNQIQMLYKSTYMLLATEPTLQFPKITLKVISKCYIITHISTYRNMKNKHVQELVIQIKICCLAYSQVCCAKIYSPALMMAVMWVSSWVMSIRVSSTVLETCEPIIIFKWNISKPKQTSSWRWHSSYTLLWPRLITA